MPSPELGLAAVQPGERKIFPFPQLMYSSPNGTAQVNSAEIGGAHLNSNPLSWFHSFPGLVHPWVCPSPNVPAPFHLSPSSPTLHISPLKLTFPPPKLLQTCFMVHLTLLGQRKGLVLAIEQSGLHLDCCSLPVQPHHYRHPEVGLAR